MEYKYVLCVNDEKANTQHVMGLMDLDALIVIIWKLAKKHERLLFKAYTKQEADQEGILLDGVVEVDPC